MKSKKSIVIIEDEPQLQQSLVEQLTAKGFDAYGYSSAEKGFEGGMFSYCSLVIMDIQLPGMSGLAATVEIKKQFPFLPVIMLTAYSDIDNRMQGFETGADDYVIKPFFMEELVARINAVLKRYEMVTRKKTVYLIDDLLIDVQTKVVHRSQQVIKLSQTEFKLLCLLAEEEGHPVSKEQIIEKVWKGSYHVSDNTVEVYINMLRNKVDKPFKRKLIYTKPGFGYYLSQNS